MNLQLTETELRPLIEMVTRQVIDQVAADGATLGADRLAYSEPESAALLGARPHVLRDARLRGEIVATKVGGRIAYERAELLEYLTRQRQTNQ